MKKAIRKDMPKVGMTSTRKIQETKPTNPCQICKETDWWEHIDGRFLCRVCHPPFGELEKKAEM